MSIFTFIVLSLATFRLSRLFVVDQLTEPLRERIWKSYPPNTQLGYLFTCIWCFSFWVGSFLIFWFTIVPTATFLVSVVLALSTVSGLIYSKLDN